MATAKCEQEVTSCLFTGNDRNGSRRAHRFAAIEMILLIVIIIIIIIIIIINICSINIHRVAQKFLRHIKIKLISFRVNLWLVNLLTEHDRIVTI